jgi:hypothetical protein
MFAKKTKRRAKGRGTKVKAVATGYFNDTDPYRSFPTKKEATDEGARLRKITGKKRYSRVPTFYTILQDSRKGVRTNKFGKATQGPHTIPHYYALDALVNARATNKLTEIARLRPTPERFAEIVDEEIPAGHKKRPRAEVAVERYKHLYEKGDELLKKKNPSVEEEIKSVHTLNKALQLHPYQTYSYKGAGAGKTALQGKGERRGLDVTIDLPHTAGFADNAATQKVLERLLKRYGKFQRTDAVG